MKREELLGKKDAKTWRKIFSSQEFVQDFTYDGSDLGSQYTNSATTFKLWAPTADKVVLQIFESGDLECEECSESISMTYTDRGVFAAEVKGDYKNKYYTYVVTRNDETVETQDPYGKACGVNGKRSMVVDLSSTQPEQFEKDTRVVIPEEERVFYELHVKDFSAAESSGVQKEYRGKYMAFTEKNTTLNGDGEHKTCLSYIKELGVSHVHILPMYDYGSVDETEATDAFNWGYDPENYNVPEGSYATDAHDGNVRIRECKQMIQSLHEEGIGVIMDVVYNHTYKLDSCFEKVCPYYYYRQNEDGSFSDGSACGNETASERYMYSRYMVDSVVYWAKEYHIDGFRFDLMGLHDTETMNTIRRALDELREQELGRKPLPHERIIMYGEPWIASDSPMEEGFIPAIRDNVAKLDEGIAVFCDLTRDYIKGSVFKKTVPGFVNAKKRTEVTPKEQEVFASIISGWANSEEFQPISPRQVINYVSAHDNYTLWDKLCLSTKKSIDYTKKYSGIMLMNAMCAGMYFICQGTPFLQAGEEFGRTKEGIGDSYASPIEINRLDWERAYQFDELVSYYKELIALRKEYNGFESFTEHSEEKISIIESSKEVLAYAVTSEKNNLLFYINPMHEKVEHVLPKGEYIIRSAGLNNYLKGQKVKEKLTLPELSVVILSQEK